MYLFICLLLFVIPIIFNVDTIYYLTPVQVDVLVNNGARGQLAWIKETPLEVDRALLELNVVGTISITKAVLSYMLQQQGGDIVVVSSGNGKFGIIIWNYTFGLFYCIYNVIKGILSLANTILYEGFKQQGNCIYFLLLKGH